MEREAKILSLRPAIDLTINGDKNLSEEFMHTTLRPILKLQHEVICTFITNQKHLNLDLLKGKTKTGQEKRNYLNGFIAKNTELKSKLTGMIIGLFTLEEMNNYLLNTKSFNKRIIEMVSTRYLSTFIKL